MNGLVSTKKVEEAKKNAMRIAATAVATAIALSTSGCSSDKNTDTSEEIKGVTVETYVGADYDEDSNQFDKCFDLNKPSNLEQSTQTFEFLIDYRNTTDENDRFLNTTFGKIIGEKHLSTKLQEGYEWSGPAIFRDNNFFTFPEAYGAYDSITRLIFISGNESSFDIYKIRTLDGEVLYYTREKIEMGSWIEDGVRLFTAHEFCKKDQDGDVTAIYQMNDKDSDVVLHTGTIDFSTTNSDGEEVNKKCNYYSVPYIKEGDEMVVETLFRINEENEYEILARKQSGIGSECEDVVSNNVGDIDNAIASLDDTIFSQLSEQTYEESYIKKVLYNYSNSTEWYETSEADTKESTTITKTKK